MEEKQVTRSYFEPLTFSTFKNGVKDILQIGWILALTIFLEFMMLSISVFFCSRLGQNEMAAITFAQAFLSTICVVPAAGMMTVCNTYFSVGQGANEGRLQGIFLQKAVFLSIITALFCSSILINIEDILHLLQQHPDVITHVGVFVRMYIPATPALFLSMALSRVLQCREKVMVTMWALLFSVGVDVILNVVFVSVLETGFRGSAGAIVISQYLNLIILSIYVYKNEDLEFFSWKSLEDWFEFFSIAVYGCLSIGVVQFSYMIAYILTGQFGALNVALFGALELCILYVILIMAGLTCAVTILVGQNLGRNEPRQAKITVEISIILFFGIVTSIAIVLMALRNYAGYIYTTDREIIAEVGSLLPLTVPVILSASTVLLIEAVLCACGRQHVGMITGLICYSIGLIMAVIFAFVLGWEKIGIWMGLIIGDALQAMLMIPFLLTLDFEKEAELAIERCRVSQTEELNQNFYQKDKFETSLEMNETQRSHKSTQAVDKTESSSLIETPENFQLSKKTIIIRLINVIVPLLILFTSFFIYIY